MTLPGKVDIAVIGGGISGLGVSLEAALNGFSVALFERDELAAATSNNSLRIIHGGIRYLQQLHVPRVLESLRAQAELLADFPDIIKPLPCLMPLSSSGMKSRLPMSCAAAVYNLLARYEEAKPGAARTVSSDFITQKAACLAPLAPRGAFLWHDALLHDPAALVRAVSEKAIACGAAHFQRTRVTAISREGKEFIVAVSRDGVVSRVRSKVVVDASGPWLDSLIDKRNRLNGALAESWCKAFNLVLSKQLDPLYAIGLHSPQRRLFFAVPRNGGTALGTAYIAHTGPPEKAHVSPQEIELFLADFRATWPQANVSAGDVQSVECGVLPMQFVGPFGPVLYGQEKVVDRDGYVSVMSTKYTTFREQARRAVAAARSYLS